MGIPKAIPRAHVTPAENYDSQKALGGGPRKGAEPKGEGRWPIPSSGAGRVGWAEFGREGPISCK